MSGKERANERTYCKFLFKWNNIFFLDTFTECHCMCLNDLMQCQFKKINRKTEMLVETKWEIKEWEQKAEIKYTIKTWFVMNFAEDLHWQLKRTSNADPGQTRIQNWCSKTKCIKKRTLTEPWVDESLTRVCLWGLI